VIINEREAGFIRDFEELIHGLVPTGSGYRHDDMSVRTENVTEEDHEYPNGHAHCKHALIGSASETIPIVDGQLQLGQWQRVFFIELDRARDRKVFIQVLGE
jgi:secondary thiamine-phosphate synthase enzyme